MKRINDNAPRARLLLYDYEPIVKFVPAYYEDIHYYRRTFNSLRVIPTTHSVAVPLNLAIEVNNYDTKLYKFGIPFSHQITFRYMNAQDLEFEKTALDASKGFADRKNLSKYVLVITIGPEDRTNQPDITVNTEAYELLTPSNRNK